MKKLRLVFCFGLAILLGVAVGIMATSWLPEKSAYAEKTAPHAKVLQAERFELVDDGGHEHASLGFGPDGNPSLVLFDVDHNVRVVVEMMADGNARMFFSDQEGKVRSVIGTAADGSPVLQLKGEDRQVIWSAP
jgi:hypothetical protein